MNRRLAATICAVVTVVLAGCGSPGSPTPSPTSTVVVANARTGSSIPSWGNSVEQQFQADLARGASWTFVSDDGRPSVVGSLDLTVAGDNDLVRAGNANALHDEAQRLLGTLRAAAPEVDLLTALDMAGRVLIGQPGPRTILLLDSLLQTSGVLRFQDQEGALMSADPVAITDRLQSAGELPELDGVTVVLIGAGDTVPPQEPLPAPTRSALIALWTAVLQRAGAVVRVDQAPVAARVAVGLPAVTPVPVTPPSAVSTGPVSLSDSEVGFLPDQAVLRDPAEAAAMLQPFAARLMAGYGRVRLTGTTSSAGDQDGRLALSNDRARAIADLLVAAGVAPSKIDVEGVGSEFAGFVPDRDAAGTLDPVTAARNRQVIIQPLPG